MAESFNPSLVTIETAMLKTVDGRQHNISPMIYGFSIKSSIYDSSFSATLSVFDSLGFRNNKTIQEI